MLPHWLPRVPYSVYNDKYGSFCKGVCSGWSQDAIFILPSQHFGMSEIEMTQVSFLIVKYWELVYIDHYLVCR